MTKFSYSVVKLMETHWLIPIFVSSQVFWVILRGNAEGNHPPFTGYQENVVVKNSFLHKQNIWWLMI